MCKIRSCVNITGIESPPLELPISSSTPIAEPHAEPTVNQKRIKDGTCSLSKERFKLMDILDIFVILLYCSEVSYEHDEQFGDSEDETISICCVRR